MMLPSSQLPDGRCKGPSLTYLGWLDFTAEHTHTLVYPSYIAALLHASKVITSHMLIWKPHNTIMII